MSTHLYDIDTLFFIGLSEEEATIKLKETGWIVRTIFRDGQNIPCDEDILRGNRANLEVQDGKVFEISIG